MSMDWTIDTNVLYKAADVDYDAIAFLHRVSRGGCRVAFDFEGHIEREYQKCFKKVRCEGKGGSGQIQKWFTFVISRCAQKFCGKLHKKYRLKFQELGLHSNDWPFVCVCEKTVNKNLVSEDTNYTDEIKNYLKQEMNVCVLSIQDSLKI